MGLDRRGSDKKVAHHVKLGDVPRMYPEDEQKLKVLAEFVTSGLPEMKDVSLKRLTALHVEFKDDGGLMVKLDRAAEGSISFRFTPSRPAEPAVIDLPKADESAEPPKSSQQLAAEIGVQHGEEEEGERGDGS